jgi:ubiquinol-cytochrome c reductase cytochrome c subunit
MTSSGQAARSLVAWAALGAVALLLVSLAGRAPAEARLIEVGEDVEDSLHRGGELYQRWCATCHATDGTGTRDGPSLEGLGLAYIDLTMRTGRMPLPDPERGVREHLLSDEARELTNLYLADLLDLEDDIPDPPAGDVRNGQQLYVVHCAACHGATGSGGVSGAGTTVPAVTGLERVALAQATRVGPFAMPAFAEETIDEQELGDLVDFVLEMSDRPRTPLGLIELNRVTAAAFAAVLLALLIGGMRLLGTWRMPPPDTDPEEKAP